MEIYTVVSRLLNDVVVLILIDRVCSILKAINT